MLPRTLLTVIELHGGVLNRRQRPLPGFVTFGGIPLHASRLLPYTKQPLEWAATTEAIFVNVIDGGRVTITVDTTFDVRLDANGGDPDATSPTLRAFHKALWSKALPNGIPFLLQVRGAGLYHHSDLGEFFLSSDSIIPTFRGRKVFAPIEEQIAPEVLDDFENNGHTIAGKIIFPSKKVEGKLTINGARGWNRQIDDRFDLTLECIRRYYSGQHSPLYDTLLRYASFFSLFGDFKGYVDFFLLQDLVSDDYASVTFFTPFDDFATLPMPNSLAAYLRYKEHTIDFLQKRNQRIKDQNF